MTHFRPLLSLIIVVALLSVAATTQKKPARKSETDAPDSLKNVPMPGLQFRGIGPALMGGRIVDIEVNPHDHSEYYVASGHGSLWKTTNSGVTFRPVFDGQVSHSIGVVEIDPSNPNIVWVGTGENDNQYNVVYGDGVYKSENGGKNWTHTGLQSSEHIGGIVVDPRNSDVVYVAAYGPLRKAGGNRGIYKSNDGGKNWQRVLYISEYTGFYEIHMDPMHPDVLYGVAHQRMRTRYTNVSGGPETGIYRTLDGGESWTELTEGLPKGDMGRIGMAVSPANPDVLHAIIEAGEDEKGVYRSEDRGASWTKMSSYMSAYPFYFQKLFADAKDPDRLYSGDIMLQVSEDGGKTWSDLGEKNKHVDNHAVWVDPSDTKHLLVGCDGGLYETFDQGRNWDFKNNLPIAEIYKVSTDNDTPFYNIYGGTQDNNSFGGPSRTTSVAGITNQDWFITHGGDGFETQVDWKDPNILYAQAQYGALARYDKRSGESIYIQPQDFADTAYRWDWDSPLLISSHKHTRLYFGANKLFRSEDRGNSWEVVSPDLTRGVPQQFESLMDRTWSIEDLVYKGTMAQLTTIAESPVDEKILYTGSGDGLIFYSQDFGDTWSRSTVPGLPAYSRVHHIVASHHNVGTAYAACHALNSGDYKPYLYKTTDGGKSWSLINGNLPETGSTYTVGEDHIEEDLLFVGTQRGLYFTVDGGKEWIAMKNGIPPVTVMDLDIQQRENDLVVSTFGRGIYILDDYSPLRHLSRENIANESMIFPVKDAIMYIPRSPFGYKGVGFQGSGFFSAPNPPLGATFTYYLREDVPTKKEARKKRDKAIREEGGTIEYPPYDTLRHEGEEEKPFLLFVIVDASGNTIRKMKAEPKKGIHRITWDYRYDNFEPVSLQPFDDKLPWVQKPLGYMVVPGTYSVSLQLFSDNIFTELAPPQSFVCKSMDNVTLPAKDLQALERFNRNVAELTRTIAGANVYRSELVNKTKHLKKAVLQSAGVPNAAYGQILEIEKALNTLDRKLNGDPLRSRYEGAAPTSVRGRVDMITYSLWTTRSAPTETFVQSYEKALEDFGGILADLEQIDGHIQDIEEQMETQGAPYTPGRIPGR